MLVKIVALGLKRIDRAALGRSSPTTASGACGLAQPVFLLVQLAVAVDRQQQVLGQRVDDRDADAVQTAGDLVGGVVELTAGVQHGHDDFGRRAAFFRVDIDGIPRPLSDDGDGFVGVDRDR